MFLSLLKNRRDQLKVVYKKNIQKQTFNSMLKAVFDLWK